MRMRLFFLAVHINYCGDFGELVMMGTSIFQRGMVMKPIFEAFVLISNFGFMFFILPQLLGPSGS
jgi:uncharacterized membrane protein